MRKYFKILKVNKFDPELFFSVLKGDMLGGMYHGHIEETHIADILSKYLMHPLAKLRGDIVPAKILGSFHFNKEIEEYFTEVDACKSAIHELLTGDDHFLNVFMDELSHYLGEKGVKLRLAEHQGSQVNPYAIRTCWASATADVILPHEDGAQLLNPKQRGFEIQQCLKYPVLGFNVCLQDETESTLSIWNIQPDDKVRKKFNIEFTGYPYSFAYLDDFEKIEQRIKVGDMYFFDARNVHAVSSGNNSGGSRTTLSFFIAFVDDNTVIYWT